MSENNIRKLVIIECAVLCIDYAERMMRKALEIQATSGSAASDSIYQKSQAGRELAKMLQEASIRIGAQS